VIRLAAVDGFDEFRANAQEFMQGGQPDIAGSTT